MTTGILTVDDTSLGADDRSYSLPEGHTEVLTNRDSLAYLTPFVRLLVAAGLKLPDLIEAYKTGGGVSWSQFGDDMRTGQAEMNRPWFLSELGTSWFPAVPSLDEALRNEARVADVGCGEGWSSIAIAKAYAAATVDGYDIDELSNRGGSPRCRCRGCRRSCPVPSRRCKCSRSVLHLRHRDGVRVHP